MVGSQVVLEPTPEAPEAPPESTLPSLEPPSRELPSLEPSEPLPGESAPPLPSRAPGRIEVRHPRCPFCHEDVRGGEESSPCLHCRAWHHTECWSEGGSRCGACGRRGGAPTPRRILASGSDALRNKLVLSSWIFTLGVCLVVDGCTDQLGGGSFQRSSFVADFFAGPFGSLPGLAILTLVLVGATRPRAEQREGWSCAGAVLAFMLLMGVFAVMAASIHLYPVQ